MELWIRSQDKVMLTQVSLLHIDRDEEDGRYLFFDTDLLLGIYKTKERALEVLNEIENKIKYMGKTYEIGTIQDERLIPHKYNYVDNVYEMPQE